jgi:hypothetical protein
VAAVSLCFFFLWEMGVFLPVSMADIQQCHISFNRIKTFEQHNHLPMGLGPDNPVWALSFI